MLDRLVQAKRCFVVRSVAVDRAPDEQHAAAAMPMYNPRDRYRQYAPPPVVTQRPNRPGNVLLDENKLLIEMRVDVVRLKDPVNPANAARQVAQQ